MKSILSWMKLLLFRKDRLFSFLLYTKRCCSVLTRAFILFKFMKILSSKNLCSLLLGNEQMSPEGLSGFRGLSPLNQDCAR